MVKKPKTEYDKFGRCGFRDGTGCIRPANGTGGLGWCMSCEDDTQRAILPSGLQNYSRKRLDQFVRDNPDAWKSIKVETTQDAHYE
jgi:hypothetical protein